jgi:hypothetical protein
MLDTILIVGPLIRPCQSEYSYHWTQSFLDSHYSSRLVFGGEGPTGRYSGRELFRRLGNGYYQHG